MVPRDATKRDACHRREPSTGFCFLPFRTVSNRFLPFLTASASYREERDSSLNSRLPDTARRMQPHVVVDEPRERHYANDEEREEPRDADQGGDLRGRGQRWPQTWWRRR